MQFPPTPQSALLGGYRDRCDGLLQFQVLPIIAESAVDRMYVSRGSQVDHLLSQAQNETAGGDLKPGGVQDIEISCAGTSHLYSRVSFALLRSSANCI